MSVVQAVSELGDQGLSDLDFKTWSKGFDVAPVAGGKTAGTYSKIGTITVPNKKVALYMYGILILIVTQAQTGGESGSPELELNSSDLGLYQERFQLEEFGFTDPIGTQSLITSVSSSFIGIPVDKQVNNQSIDIHLSSVATMTAEWDAHASIIFGNKPLAELPEDYLAELRDNFTSHLRGLSRLEQDAAKAIGSADTDITMTGIPMPNKARQLIGLKGLVMPNAGTTLEEHCYRFTYESGDIEDFAPQEYPGMSGFNGAIFGTLVGGATSVVGARYYPVRFPLPRTVFTMTVKAQNVIAITVAPDVSHAAKFR